jgi:mannose/fructose/N-acetylgalactosamine-specific phosphotransferase system component IIC
VTDPLLITAASLAVAFLCLDQTALGQTMISQPLVGGLILGALFGRPLEGLAAGTLLQFLCLNEMTLGASIPSDNSFAGLTGTAFFLAVQHPPGWSSSAVLGVAVAFFLPVAIAARSVDILVRRANGHWTETARRFIAEERYGAAQLAGLGGLPLFFTRAFLLSWLVLWIFATLLAALPEEAGILPGLLGLLARLVPFAGLGAIVARQRGRAAAAVATVFFFVGLLLTWRLS